jgi:hypothetical protein
MNPGSETGKTEAGERGPRSPHLFSALTELVLVAGGCLLAIFWIIPSQTASASAYGMSPSMMPVACASAVALLALLQFFASLWRPSAANGPNGKGRERPGMGHALLLMLAALAGAFVLSRFGLVAGGVALALLVSLVIGEHRLRRNALLCCAVAAVMLLVDVSGI